MHTSPGGGRQPCRELLLNLRRRNVESVLDGELDGLVQDGFNELVSMGDWCRLKWHRAHRTNRRGAVHRWRYRRRHTKSTVQGRAGAVLSAKGGLFP